MSDIDVQELLGTENIVVGLDIGEKTVGIAVSDRRIKIATGLATVARSAMEHDCQSVFNHVKSYAVGLVIFGWPLHMNNTHSEQCKNSLSFCNALSTKLIAKYAKWDERFSTSVVDRIMVEASMSRRRRKQVIDKTAATYILQGALDFMNNAKSHLGLSKIDQRIPS
ncbi:MAG: Holliday junction resolvase RuvX [Holosporaceae bacterium]|nr:Holliday junction resolvase RuvX [Holosporaceae bacterium]